MRHETEHSPSAFLNSVLFQGEPHASPHPHRLRSPECGGWSLSGKCYSGSRLEKVGDLAGLMASNPVVPPKNDLGNQL